MYEQTFGLSAPPFQINPDPSFYFESKGHGHAHQYLRFGAFQGEGFIVVTGEIGAGKTTLLRALLAELDPAKVVAAQIVSTQLEAGELLAAVALAFGITAEGMNKARLLATLEAYLASLATSNRRALLIIDEAQNLSPAAIEELRMLSNFQFGSKALLQSFLVGQPELRDLLRLPQMEQLRQRVIASCHLGPMDAVETRAYVEHRLKHVGWNGEPGFADDAFTAIHALTGGVPRRINMLCSRLLLSVFLDNETHVDVARVHRVAEDIRAELSGNGLNADAVSAETAQPTPFTQPARKAEPPPRNLEAPHDAEAGSPFDGARELPTHISRDAGGLLLCVTTNLPAQIAMTRLQSAIADREDLPHAVVVHLRAEEDIPVWESTQAMLGRTAGATLNLPLSATTSVGRAAEVLAHVGALLQRLRPDALIIHADDRYAPSCALAAEYGDTPVVRIDGGWPDGATGAAEMARLEWLNQSADLLLVADPAAISASAADPDDADTAAPTGSPLIDALLAAHAAIAPLHAIRMTLGLPPTADLSRYGVVLLEGSDLDAPGGASPAFAERCNSLASISQSLPLIWPVSSAQRAFVDAQTNATARSASLHLIDSCGYGALLSLLEGAACVITDAGWIQDQCAALGVPCLVPAPGRVRDAARRIGSVAPAKPGLRPLFHALSDILTAPAETPTLPALWDGRAAQRIALRLSNWLLAQQDRDFQNYLQAH